jgi:hypothetical protein
MNASIHVRRHPKVVFTLLLIQLCILHFMLRYLLSSNAQEQSTSSHNRHFSSSPLNLNALEKIPLKKFFFAGIVSTCMQYERRQTMRAWLKKYSSIMDFKFVMDKVEYQVIANYISAIDCSLYLEAENKKHNDLMFIDTRPDEQGAKKLAYKVQSMFNWVSSNYRFQYRYIVKSDDDTLIQFDKWRELIEKEYDQKLMKKQKYLQNHPQRDQILAQSSYVYSGYFMKNSRVVLNGANADTGYFSKTSLPRYVAYAQGSAYAISSAIANTIEIWSRVAVLDKWMNEDATIGHWISSLKHDKIQVDKVALYGDMNEPKCGSDTIIFHPFKSPEILQRFAFLVRSDQWEDGCSVVSPMISSMKGYRLKNV